MHGRKYGRDVMSSRQGSLVARPPFHRKDDDRSRSHSMRRIQDKIISVQESKTVAMDAVHSRSGPPSISVVCLPVVVLVF